MGWDSWTNYGMRCLFFTCFQYTLCLGLENGWWGVMSDFFFLLPWMADCFSVRLLKMELILTGNADDDDYVDVMVMVMILIYSDDYDDIMILI